MSSFVGALQLIFITLKLMNIITWPWTVVLIPSWIGVAIVFFVAIGACITILLDNL